MAGTIVVDRLESDASYASSVNIASPLVIANTISMTNGSITGNVNFDSGTLFVDAPGNKVGVGTNTPLQKLDIFGNAIRMDNGSYIGYIGSQLALNASGDASDFTVRSDNALTFSSGGPYERMRIDSSGRVTEPNQPAFRAIRAGAFSIPASTYYYQYDFNDDSDTSKGAFDRAGNFNTSTGRFTAPVTGVYYFSASLLFSNNPIRPFLNFAINGGMISGYIGTWNAGDTGVSFSCVLRLNSSDYVTVHTSNESGSPASINPDHKFTHFSGYLLG